MSAAVERTICLHPVPDNPAATMITGWGQGMNSALKAIKGMRSTSHINGKGFIILISTNFTFCHFFAPF
jgi:hypothetical protein